MVQPLPQPPPLTSPNPNPYSNPSPSPNLNPCPYLYPHITLTVQGEGALEGGYAHYRMRAQHEHDFRFSRFNCSDAPFRFATPRKRAAPPPSVPPFETQSVVMSSALSGEGVEGSGLT